MSVRSDFWLVQRLTEPWVIRPERGFDGYFSLDYMGSAEFEFGAVQDSLRNIRSVGDIEVFEHEVTVNDVTRPVHFVGPEKWLLNEVEKVQTWLDGGARGKERSYFPERLDGSADEWKQRTVAWWSLNNDVAWALDEDVAKTLVTAFGPKDTQ